MQLLPAHLLHLFPFLPDVDWGHEEQQHRQPREIHLELRVDYLLVDSDHSEEFDKVQKETGVEHLSADFGPDHFDCHADPFIGKDLDAFLFREHVEDHFVAQPREGVVVWVGLDLGLHDHEFVIVLPACVLFELVNVETGLEHALHLALEVVNLVKGGGGHKCAHEIHDVFVAVIASVFFYDVFDTVLDHVDGAYVILPHEVLQVLAHHWHIFEFQCQIEGRVVA